MSDKEPMGDMVFDGVKVKLTVTPHGLEFTDKLAQLERVRGIVTPHVRMPLAERHHVVAAAMAGVKERLFNGEDGEQVWNDAMDYIEDKFNNWG